MDSEIPLCCRCTSSHGTEADALMMECEGCHCNVHMACLRVQNPPITTIAGDNFFDLMCSECSDTEDGYDIVARKHIKLHMAILIAMYNLHKCSSRRAHYGYFHWRDDIFSFISRHQHLLFQQQQHRIVPGSFCATMTKFPQWFQSGNSSPLVKSRGYYRLKKVLPPALLLKALDAVPAAAHTTGIKRNRSTSRTFKGNSCSANKRMRTQSDGSIAGGDVSLTDDGGAAAAAAAVVGASAVAAGGGEEDATAADCMGNNVSLRDNENSNEHSPLLSAEGNEGGGGMGESEEDEEFEGFVLRPALQTACSPDGDGREAVDVDEEQHHYVLIPEGNMGDIRLDLVEMGVNETSASNVIACDNLFTIGNAEEVVGLYTTVGYDTNENVSVSDNDDTICTAGTMAPGVNNENGLYYGKKLPISPSVNKEQENIINSEELGNHRTLNGDSSLSISSQDCYADSEEDVKPDVRDLPPYRSDNEEDSQRQVKSEDAGGYRRHPLALLFRRKTPTIPMDEEYRQDLAAMESLRFSNRLEEDRLRDRLDRLYDLVPRNKYKNILRSIPAQLRRRGKASAAAKYSGETGTKEDFSVLSLIAPDPLFPIELATLRRKLHTRKEQRAAGLGVFDIEAEMDSIECRGRGYTTEERRQMDARKRAGAVGCALLDRFLMLEPAYIRASNSAASFVERTLGRDFKTPPPTTTPRTRRGVLPFYLQLTDYESPLRLRLNKKITERGGVGRVHPQMVEAERGSGGDHLASPPLPPQSPQPPLQSSLQSPSRAIDGGEVVEVVVGAQGGGSPPSVKGRKGSSPDTTACSRAARTNGHEASAGTAIGGTQLSINAAGVGVCCTLPSSNGCKPPLSTPSTSASSGTKDVNASSGTRDVNTSSGTTDANTSSGSTGVNTCSGSTGVNTCSGATGVNTSSGATGVNTFSGATGVNISSGATDINTSSGAAGVNTSSGAPAINTFSGATGVNISSGATDINTSSGAAGVNTSSGAPAINTFSGATGVNISSGATYINTSSGSTGVNTSSSATGVNTSSSATGVNTTSGATDVNTSSGATGVNTSSSAAGVNTTSGATDVNTSSGATGVNTSSSAAGVNTTSGAADVNISSGATDINTSSGATGVNTSSGATGVNTSSSATGVNTTSGATDVNISSGATDINTSSGATGVNTSSGATGVNTSSSATGVNTTSGATSVNISGATGINTSSGATGVNTSSGATGVNTSSSATGVNTTSGATSVNISGATSINTSSGATGINTSSGDIGVNTSSGAADFNTSSSTADFNTSSSTSDFSTSSGTSDNSTTTSGANSCNSSSGSVGFNTSSDTGGVEVVAGASNAGASAGVRYVVSPSGGGSLGSSDAPVVPRPLPPSPAFSTTEWRRAPLHFCPVRNEHLAQMNALARMCFWPNIELSEVLRYPDHTCVALYRLMVVGFGVAVPDSISGSVTCDAYISFLVVHPEWRRVGVATSILYCLTHEIKDSNLTAHVPPTSPAMILYQRFGFKREAFVKNFYYKYLSDDRPDDRNAFFMRRRKL